MLDSVGFGSDMLWKGTIPFKEKHFTITLFVTLYCLKPPHILFCEGPPRKGCLLFGPLTSVIACVGCFLALIVSAILSVNSSPNNALSCFWKTDAFSFNIAASSVVDIPVTPRNAFLRLSCYSIATILTLQFSLATLIQWPFVRLDWDWETIQASVPQGSILRPLFFLIYIDDLTVKLNSNVKLFADDTLSCDQWSDHWTRWDWYIRRHV